MAHPQQQAFCLSVKQQFAASFQEKFVLDVGSLDINGNNQYLFENCLYLGLDVAPGRNVDIVCKGHELALPDATFDTVISTECFEHDQFYAQTLNNCVRLLKPGGLFVFSCATTGRPEHGTRRTTPQDAPLLQEFEDWGDYYKNLDESDIRAVLDVDAEFSAYGFSVNEHTCDLYFWGVKHGSVETRAEASFLLRNAGLRDELQMLTERQRVLELRCAELEATIAERNASLQAMKEALRRETERARILDRTNIELAQTNQRLTDDIAAQRKVVQTVEAAAAEANARHREVLASRSWALTAPVRTAATLLGGDLRPVTRYGPAFRTATRAIARGEFSLIADRWRSFRRDAAASLHYGRHDAPSTWCVLTTPHTLTLAKQIAAHLASHGWRVDVTTELPERFDHDFYFVLCAQMFERLPPGEKRIVFQLEQSVSSRWFTQAYLDALEQSRAVVDYSLSNIAFLETRGIRYPHVYYLPIGASATVPRSPPSSEPDHDVLFYGDHLSSPRRQRLLDALRQEFRVRVASERFGDDMTTMIQNAPVVVNLHYYEGALLETPRIHECLALGTPVVSEDSADQHDYPELAGAVEFFETGSIPAMLAAIRRTLARADRHETAIAAAQRASVRFRFMLDRLLIGLNLLPTSQSKNLVLPIPADQNIVALSLPETTARRAVLREHPLSGTWIFDGLRHTPGWIGCGLSYAALARHAVAHGHDEFTVYEDDALLPPDIDTRLTTVHRFLADHGGAWDLFCGLIASVHPETKVREVYRFEGMTFVIIDKMTSMVFNVYHRRFLHILQAWEAENRDAATNTIDRFIERRTDLRVVVTLPFLAGHREEVHSTLWGFQNTQYRDLIAASEADLQRRVDAFLDASAPVAAP